MSVTLGMPEEDQGIAGSAEVPAGLEEADLSPWFNPFLTHFVREARRCGGAVQVVREGELLRALLVTDPTEKISTVFTRSPSQAETWVRGRGPHGMFSDYPFEPTDEEYTIFSRSLRSDPPAHRFRHPVRSLSPSDLPAVRDLMMEVYGLVNDRWFQGVPNRSEAGFVCEVGGRLAGVAWVSLAGRHARLHSLTVRAPFRRMGLGSDLLAARLLWSDRMGAHTVLSEVSVRNVASQTVATGGGMRRVGSIYFHPPR